MTPPIFGLTDIHRLMQKCKKHRVMIKQNEKYALRKIDLVSITLR